MEGICSCRHSCKQISSFTSTLGEVGGAKGGAEGGPSEGPRESQGNSSEVAGEHASSKAPLEMELMEFLPENSLEAQLMATMEVADEDDVVMPILEDRLSTNSRTNSCTSSEDDCYVVYTKQPPSPKRRPSAEW